MTARVLLGIFAALRAVMIPGQAAQMCSQPLSWPRLNLLHACPVVAGDLGEIVAEAPAA